MYRVVMTRRLMPAAQEQVTKQCEVRVWEEDGPIPRNVLAEWLKDAEGLVASPNVRVDGELLDFGPQLRVVAQSAVGYNNIDIYACTRRGVPVGYTPGVLVEATADLAFGLLLCAARRIHEGWDFVRRGQWHPNRNIAFGVELAGKTLGIVGMGQIGSAVARRARASGMKVLYHNRTKRADDRETGAEYTDFGALLGQADFIAALLPLSPETKGLFGREQFALMKRTAYFVNASRGQVVDTAALVEALSTDKIAYAALDVTDPEPLPGDHPLLKLPNVLITPHIGSATAETRNEMSRLTADNLLAGLAGNPLPACVNTEVNYKVR